MIAWAQGAGVNLPPLPGYRAGVPADRSSDAGSRAGGTVQLVRPLSGLTVRLTNALPRDVQSLPVEALVTGEAPDAVRIEVDGVAVAMLREAPYRVAWPVTSGLHRLRAVAVYGTREAASDDAAVTVLPASP